MTFALISKIRTATLIAAGLLVVVILSRFIWLVINNEFNPLNGEYIKKLGGNYRLMRMNGSEVVICHGRNVITGNVQEIAISLPYVTGYTTVLTGDADPIARDRAGFFVINTATANAQNLQQILRIPGERSSTDELKEGLTKQQWSEELNHIGIPNIKLVKPPFGYSSTFWEL